MSRTTNQLDLGRNTTLEGGDFLLALFWRLQQIFFTPLNYFFKFGALLNGGVWGYSERWGMGLFWTVGYGAILNGGVWGYSERWGMGLFWTVGYGAILNGGVWGYSERWGMGLFWTVGYGAILNGGVWGYSERWGMGLFWTVGYGAILNGGVWGYSERWGMGLQPFPDPVLEWQQTRVFRQDPLTVVIFLIYQWLKLLQVLKAQEFVPFKNIKMLSMTNVGLLEIAKNVFEMATLEELYLGWNSISAESLANFNLPNLKILVLQGNPLHALTGS